MNDLDHPQLIFESTDIYSRGMERFYCVNQISYIQMNPLETKFETSALRSWRTDQADAHKLTCLGPTLRQTDNLPIRELVLFELKERVRFHLEIENEQSRLKPQILELLHQTFPGLERLFSSRYSIIALNITEIFTHPNMVLDVGKEVLIIHVFNSTDKGMSIDKAAKYAFQLEVITQGNYPNVDRHPFLVEKLRLLIQQLKQSIHHLRQLDDTMIQLAQQLDYFENVRSIPDIDGLSTAMITGEIGDIKRFKSNKQLNAFVSIDIKRYQPGHAHYRSTVNERDNKRAKKLLFWVVMNIIRGQHHYNNHVVDYYYRLRKQPSGKPHRIAIIACINRLLKTIHYLVVNRKLYDYQMSPH